MQTLEENSKVVQSYQSKIKVRVTWLAQLSMYLSLDKTEPKLSHMGDTLISETIRIRSYLINEIKINKPAVTIEAARIAEQRG
jgi:hypothetical protein